MKIITRNGYKAIQGRPEELDELLQFALAEAEESAEAMPESPVKLIIEREVAHFRSLLDDLHDVPVCLGVE